MSIKATPTAGSKLLTPADHTLVMIDFQSQMAFATQSIDAVNLRNNAALVAQAAAGFKVPTILTTVAEKSFSGPMFRRDHRRLCGPEDARPHVDEHLGRRRRDRPR
jgi:nicotinamidase-related amidase